MHETKMGEYMNEILKRPIKELIAEFPAVGAVMTRFGIGCVTCAVGTCLTGDVVGIHGLDADAERRLFREIEAILAGKGGTGVLGRTPSSSAVAAASPAELSRPMRVLVAEHATIKKVLAMIPSLARALDPMTEEGRARAAEAIFFIRNYADRYHHAKEEDLLFRLFDENLEIIRVMNQDHESGRAFVLRAEQSLAGGDGAGAIESFSAYAALLSDHIRREDEILYPWMDSRLDDPSKQSLFASFAEVDRSFNQEALGRCFGFANAAAHRDS